MSTETRSGPRRRRWVPVALFLAFVVMPVLEIWVILQVGGVIGGWWTVLLLVVDSIIGAWLVRREGARAWTALQEALRRGAVPGREIADGALVLVGGTLLLTPGFVTDAMGAILVLPLTRPLLRHLLAQTIMRRLIVAGPGRGPAGPFDFPGGYGPGQQPGTGTAPGGQEPPRRPPESTSGPVVRGEVVEDE